MKPINLVTLCDEKYLVGLLTLLYSVRKHNHFDMVLYVIDIGLTDQSKKLLVEYCLMLDISDVQFIQVDKEDYASRIYYLDPAYDIEQVNQRCRPEVFAKFEMFKLLVDNILYLDCDLLCIGSLNELVLSKEEINVTYVEDQRDFVMVMDETTPKYHFNSGMMFFNGGIINKDTTDQLKEDMSKFRPPTGDEQIFNFTFKDKRINYLSGTQFNYPFPYNTKNPIKASSFKELFTEQNVRMLHFGPWFDRPKPWNLSSNSTYKHYCYAMWNRYFSEMNRLYFGNSINLPLS